MTSSETTSTTAEGTRAPRTRTVRDVLRMPRRAIVARVGVWAAAAAAGLGAPWVLALYPLQLAVQAATLGLLALSIGWLLRQTGLLSFGHAAFQGIAGYAAGLLVVRLDLAPTPAILLGILGGTVFAFVVGLFVVRSPGVAFSMLTLAVGMLVWVFLTQSRTLTNGFDGMAVPFDGRVLGREAEAYIDPVTVWPVVWIVLMLAIGGFWWISRSLFGRRLAAIRENEERIRFAGWRTYWPRVMAFTLSGLCASVSGGVAVLNQGFLSPDDVFWSASGLALIVAVIGGIGSVWGPPVGAFVFIVLQAYLSQSSQYQIIIGVLLMAIVVVARGGIAGLIQSAWTWALGRRKGRVHA